MKELKQLLAAIRNGREINDHRGKVYEQEFGESFISRCEAELNNLANTAEWISVKDRLPDHLQDVWVCETTGDVTAGYYDAEKKLFYEGYEYMRNVSCWMPLRYPAPPLNP